MKLYRVTLTMTLFNVVEVEAKSRADANKKAQKLLDEGEIDIEEIDDVTINSEIIKETP